MKIKLPLTRVTSEEVKDFKEIEQDALAMQELINAGNFQGLWKKAFALSHVQVEFTTPTPKRFFVVDKEFVGKNMFPHAVIINPRVGPANKKDLLYPPEGCMSYPHRKTRGVNRYSKIDVVFQIPHRSIFGTKLKEISMQVEELMAQIFQHEIDHFNNKTIFD